MSWPEFDARFVLVVMLGLDPIGAEIARACTDIVASFVVAHASVG